MANLKEVAKLAGVSPTTVSRVLNNHPHVNKDTRNKVHQIIEELNYIPNINAINLIKGKTNLIGIVIPFSNYPYFSQLIQGISEVATQKNKKVVLFQTSYDSKQELEALEMLKLKQLDSLIICSRNISIATIESYLQYGPISIFENIKNTTLHTTYIDHYHAFKHALQYLYKLGHRDIGCVINRRNSSSSIQRLSAYKDFCLEHHIPINEELIFENYALLEDGKALYESLKKTKTIPSAIVISSDHTAAGLYLSLSETERKNFSIIGFENQEISTLLNITTVDIPLHTIGIQLFKQLSNNSITQTKFDTHLIKRHSVFKLKD